MQNPYLYLMRLAWRNVGSQKRLFAVTYVFFVLANIVHMLEPLIIGYAFNTLQLGGEGVLSRFTWWLLAATMLTPLFWSLHGPARIWEKQLAFKIERRFREKMFRMVTRMPMAWHNDHHSGETHDKMEKAATALGVFARSGFEPLSTLVTATASVVAISFIFPEYGWISLVALIFILVMVSRFDRYLWRVRREINRREHKVAQLFFDYVTNIKSIITLRVQKLVGRSYSRGIGHVFPAYQKDNYVGELKWGLQGNVIAIFTFLLLFLYVAVGLKSGEVILLGSLFAFYGYINRFTSSFFNFAWQWGELVQRQADAQSVDSIVNSYNKLERRRNYKSDIRDWQKMNVTGLFFSHADASGDVKHLDDVGIELKRGEMVALVGASGSGKSTLLHILRGLFDPDKANLIVDDKSYELGILSTITTLVPQDPEVFDNTIGYNISLGLEHTQEEIMQAVRLARFDPVLARLEKGLETSIKERGVNLSGGEKQRLALARAIFTAKDSSLILMDESTSSVDSGNELEIYKNMFKHFDNHCLVAAIHRLHLLPLFDKIYVLEEGKVIEHGSFADLTAKQDGVLAKMWQTYQDTIDTKRA